MISTSQQVWQRWTQPACLPGCLFVDFLVAIVVLALRGVMHPHRVTLPFVHWHRIAVRNASLADGYKAIVGVTQEGPCAPNTVATEQTPITVLQHSKRADGSMTPGEPHITTSADMEHTCQHTYMCVHPSFAAQIYTIKIAYLNLSLHILTL